MIFLDEPTTGFDPSARRQAWSIIDNLRSLGKTILLTTHYMDEAQHLADRVAVIARGKIIAQGTPDTLGADRRDITAVRFVFNGAARDLPVAAAIGANGAVEVEGDNHVHLTIARQRIRIPSMIAVPVSTVIGSTYSNTDPISSLKPGIFSPAQPHPCQFFSC